MLTTILITLLILYVLIFILLFVGILLLDDDKHSFADAMIILAGLIFWPLVVIWYLIDSKRTGKSDAPLEADPWL